MNFVNGGMMLKVAMQSASVTAMDVIQWRNQTDGSKMERISSKQEDLMNFVNGGMVQEVVMQSAFVTVMNAIQQRSQTDGPSMETVVRLLSK